QEEVVGIPVVVQVRLPHLKDDVPSVRRDLHLGGAEAGPYRVEREQVLDRHGPQALGERLSSGRAKTEPPNDGQQDVNPQTPHEGTPYGFGTVAFLGP